MHRSWGAGPGEVERRHTREPHTNALKAVAEKAVVTSAPGGSQGSFPGHMTLELGTKYKAAIFLGDEENSKERMFTKHLIYYKALHMCDTMEGCSPRPWCLSWWDGPAGYL